MPDSDVLQMGLTKGECSLICEALFLHKHLPDELIELVITTTVGQRPFVDTTPNELLMRFIEAMEEQKIGKRGYGD